MMSEQEETSHRSFTHTTDERSEPMDTESRLRVSKDQLHPWTSEVEIGAIKQETSDHPIYESCSDKNIFNVFSTQRNSSITPFLNIIFFKDL